MKQTIVPEEDFEAASVLRPKAPTEKSTPTKIDTKILKNLG